MEKLFSPINDGFALIGVKRTKGYELVKQRRLHIIKIGKKSLLSNQELTELASQLLAEAKANASKSGESSK